MNNEGITDKQATSLGCVLIAGVLVGLLFLVGSCFNAVVLDDSDSERCERILADYRKGAGTFSLGEASEEDVQWAIDNDCPGFDLDD